MNREQHDDADREFERRTRALLLESADRLPGALRSRLTQARHAALEAHRTAAPVHARGWMGAGAAAAVLVTLLVLVPHHRGAPVTAFAGGSVDDLELLAESDAVPLSEDQDVDYDFYEWAVNEADANTEAAPSVGT
jgi:ElaB/YqjD/DUF883 family membrane-anchored ribosome-binding protein